jgi:hypothetical protein
MAVSNSSGLALDLTLAWRGGFTSIELGDGATADFVTRSPGHLCWWCWSKETGMSVVPGLVVVAGAWTATGVGATGDTDGADRPNHSAKTVVRPAITLPLAVKRRPNKEGI